MKKFIAILAILIASTIGATSLQTVAVHADSGYMPYSYGGNAINVQAYAAGITSTAVPEDISALLGSLSFSDTAGVSACKSSSANDAAAGTGARTLYIEGLNSSFNPISETWTVVGTTGTALTNAYIRINSIRVATAGSGGTNAGAITCWTRYYAATGFTSGSRHITMIAGEGRSRSGAYTVPAGKTLLITELYATEASSTAAYTYSDYMGVTNLRAGGKNEPRSKSRVILQCLEYGKGWEFVAEVLVSRDAPAAITFDTPIRILAKTTCKLTYQAELSNTNSRVLALNISAGYRGILK